MSESDFLTNPELFSGMKQAIWGKNLLPSLIKKNPEPVHARFENTMGNPFFDFGKNRPKHQKCHLNSIKKFCFFLVCLNFIYELTILDPNYLYRY